MPARILIAEDDPAQAEIIRRFLERDGCGAAVVHDGWAALEETRRRPADLVVLDLALPGVDGLQVCRLLRAAARGAADEYRVGDLLVDAGGHEVRMRGARVPTTPGEFALLACLAAAPGRAFTRPQLLEHVSIRGSTVTGRTVDVHVMNLRRKLEPEPTRPRYLLTVRGIGYKLAEPGDVGEPDGAR